jgi:oligoendopeptidase F
MTSWSDLSERLRPLRDEPLDADGVPAFLLARDAIEREVHETFAALTRAKDEDTADEAAKAAYLAFIHDVMPHLEVVSDELNRKLLAVAGYTPPAALAQAFADLRDSVEIFRAANVPLSTEESALAQRYGEIVGATRVAWGGELLPPALVEVHLESDDRATRERAYRALNDGREPHRAALDALFLDFVRLRARIAANADFPDYRAYAWRALHRREYTPDDALALHAAVERHVVPGFRRVIERRRQRLGIDGVRPWDRIADPDGRPPLTPFADVDELGAGLERMMGALDPDFAADVALLRDGWMDLAPRANKVPGLGYQNYFPVSRRPYIYASVAGSDDDLLTLRHEVGHALHSLAVERAWPLRLHDATRPEAFEFASQALELLTLPLLTRDRGGFYDPVDAQRSRARLLERVLSLLISTSQIDALQHWIYTQDPATLDAAAIDAAWLDLSRRFDVGIDWQGLERPRSKGWHVIHLFTYPFYYLEYGIAYLGALQLYERARHDPAGALAGYRRFLEAGGTLPLDELYATAGVAFRFDDALVARLTDLLVAEILQDG